MNIQTIEIDIDHNSLSDLPKIAHKYNLDYKIIQENGPAGGNPFISLTGQKSYLSSFLVNEYCDVNDLTLYLSN